MKWTPDWSEIDEKIVLVTVDEDGEVYGWFAEPAAKYSMRKGGYWGDNKHLLETLDFDLAESWFEMKFERPT